MDGWLSLSEVEKATDIPLNTVKRYMLAHKEFVAYKKTGNMYIVRVEAVEVLKKIRILYNAGHKKQRVNELLASDGLPVTFTIDDESSTELITLNQDISDMNKDLKKLVQATLSYNQEVLKQNQQLQEEVQAMKDKVDSLHEKADIADKKIEKMIEEYQELANKGNWFSRIFKK